MHAFQNSRDNSGLVSIIFNIVWKWSEGVVHTIENTVVAVIGHRQRLTSKINEINVINRFLVTILNRLFIKCNEADSV